MAVIKASESISFPEAIAQTQSLLAQMENDEVSDVEIGEAIASLVKSMNGARGFFVTYLTDERPFADRPSESVIEALKSSPDFVGELLVKNVAMSAATAVIHRRNNDENTALSSDRVCRRSIQLIQKLKLEVIDNQLKQLHQSVVTGEGSYKEFLERWDYTGDREQLHAIQQAIKNI
jgi:hypothetical protein